MARRRSRRDPPSLPSTVRSVVSPPLIRLGPVDPIGLRLLEDRRMWHPDPLRPPKAFMRSATRLVVKSTPNALRNDTLSHRVGFAVPKKVAICIRRKQRREVILALGKGGKGARARRRRNRWSDVDC